MSYNDGLKIPSYLTVYTCVFGNTDPLHEPLETGGARFICFTDQPIKSDKWEIVKTKYQSTPTRAARLMKAMSHRSVASEWALWLDANFTLMVNPYSLLEHGEFVRFIHRDRKRISEEANEIIKLGKAKKATIQTQLATYQSDGFDTQDNKQKELSCNSAVLRRHTPAIIELNEFWAKQLSTFSLRDQMSLDYCAWKLKVPMQAWPGNHADNPYFKYTHYKRPVNDF